MSNSEDYLDDLLSSVSDANRRNNKRDIENLIQSMNQEVEKPQQKERKPPRTRGDYGEKFVREFEQEIALGTADDFLHDFEQEIDEEAATSQDSMDAEQSEEHDGYAGNVDEIMDEARRKVEAGPFVPGEEEPEESVETLRESTEEEPSEEDVTENPEEEPADMFADGFAEDMIPDGTELDERNSDGLQEEEQQDSENDELMKMLSGLSEDEELADIGAMLQNSEDGVEAEADAEALIPEEGEEEKLGFTEDGEEGVQDEFERLGSIEGLKELGKGKKKEKHKKGGFLAKLGLLLFGSEDEMEAAPVAEQGNLGSITDENLGILQELDAEAKAEAKAEEGRKKKKPKKEKKEKPKKEKKPKVKKEKPPKEKDNTPPLPKKPVILVFVMAVSILILILLGSSSIQYGQDREEAETYYEAGKYVEAYTFMAGTDVKSKDEEFYQRTLLAAGVQEECRTYESMMELEEYELALDALVCGLRRCDNYQEDAKLYGAESVINELEGQIVATLSETFGVTEERARELGEIRKRKDYTNELKQILAGLGM